MVTIQTDGDTCTFSRSGEQTSLLPAEQVVGGKWMVIVFTKKSPELASPPHV